MIGRYTWYLLIMGIIIVFFNIVVIVWKIIVHDYEMVKFMLLVLALGMCPYFLIIVKDKRY